MGLGTLFIGEDINDDVSIGLVILGAGIFGLLSLWGGLFDGWWGRWGGGGGEIRPSERLC